MTKSNDVLILSHAGDGAEPAGLPVVMQGGEFSIGRKEGNDLILPTAHISSRHVNIRHSADGYHISDLGSTNGSVVLRGEERLLLGAKGALEVLLRAGDLLLLGDIDHPVQLMVELQQAHVDESWHNTIVAVRTLPQAQVVGQEITPHQDLLRILLNLVQEISGSSNHQEILRRVAEAALEAIPGAVDALIVERTPKDGTLTIGAQVHKDRGVSREPNKKICERILKGGDAALLFGHHDASSMPAATLVGQGVGSGIAALLSGGEGFQGVLQVNCTPGRFELEEVHLNLAMVLAHHASLAIERADLINRLKQAEKQLKEENSYLRRRAQPAIEMVASSPPMRHVLSELRKAATSDVTVLLQGETGTGKEVAARYLHAQSRRAARLLVPVNCGALSENLLDSELFGHRKGSFTGATTDRKGVFEVAAGGTVLLDEIGETPPSLQVRLLRVLEEGKIKPVGETLERKVDVRIIAATNKDLPKLVQEGSFRQDLYYRLRVFPVQLPPLRERREDIEPLCRLFLERFSAQLGKKLGPLDPLLIKTLQAYDFPGNIRELANEIERAVVRADEHQPLTPELLSVEALTSSMSAAEPDTSTLSTQLARVEREIIAKALTVHGGKKIAVAEELGLTRQGLAKKMARLGF